MLKKIIVLSIFMGCLLSAVANKYDDEEKVRRYFEDIERQEQRERDAATSRYNSQNTSSGKGGAFGAIIVMGVFGLIIYGAYKLWDEC